MKKRFLVSLAAPFALIAASTAFSADPSPASTKEALSKAPFSTSLARELNTSNSPIHPFINSSLTPPEQYKNATFKLSHDYPKALPPAKKYPWKEVTKGGKITQENAYKYVEALKKYVSKDMERFIYDYDKWDSTKEKWYESIWLGTEREPIRGMYVGSGFPAGTLTDQKMDLTTYVFTMYDETAAKTLGDIWGRTADEAMNPTFTTTSTQYAEGSVIIKYAFVTPCGADWKPMQGTKAWEIYAPLNVSNGSGHSPSSKCPNNGSRGNSSDPTLTNVYMMQFDIIVKDSQAAPETGWVFSTLVYDKDAKGKNAWDKMIPLGATWGGNPKVVNLKPEALTPPVKVNTNLTENWINMKAPMYARSTLGWDGRLSGPNDGAVVTPAWVDSKYYHKGIASAGCLGCHSSAQYPMTSFLLPTATQPPQAVQAPLSNDPNSSSLVMAIPGSSLWMQWFQSNNGTTPMGPEAAGKMPVALDYDMVTAFKAIPMWQAALQAKEKK